MLTIASAPAECTLGDSIRENICKCSLSISEFTTNQLGRCKRANLPRRLPDLYIDVCTATGGYDAAMRNSSMLRSSSFISFNIRKV